MGSAPLLMKDVRNMMSDNKFKFISLAVFLFIAEVLALGFSSITIEDTIEVARGKTVLKSAFFYIQSIFAVLVTVMLIRGAATKVGLRTRFFSTLGCILSPMFWWMIAVVLTSVLALSFLGEKAVLSAMRGDLDENGMLSALFVASVFAVLVYVAAAWVGVMMQRLFVNHVASRNESFRVEKMPYWKVIFWSFSQVKSQWRMVLMFISIIVVKILAAVLSVSASPILGALVFSSVTVLFVAIFSSLAVKGVTVHRR